MHGVLFLLLLCTRTAHAWTVNSHQALPTTFVGSVPIAGLPFQLKVHGAGLDKMNDRIIIVDSNDNCPAQPVEHDLAYYMGRPCNMPGAAPTLLICGEITLHRKAEYSICVCNAEINSCDSISHFTAGGKSSGVFYINGPNVEDHTLRAGVPGLITVLGLQFHARDRIRILPKSQACSSQEVENVPELLDGATGQRTSGGHNDARWNNVLMGGGGKEYQMCWCSGMVSACLPSSYTVPIGTLIVDGPILGSTVEWTTGLVNVIHIYGTGLADTDRMSIRYGSHTCGHTSSSKHSSGVLVEPSKVRNAGTTAVSHWSKVTISMRGDYVICWCGRQAGVCTDCCEWDQHYNIEAARISVVGPLQGSYVQGIAGREFRFEMSNTLPGVNDRIRLVNNIDACHTGTQPQVVFRPPVGPPEINGTTQAWNMVISHNSLIKVCWCPEASNCFQDSDYTVDVALIEFIGPTWKQVSIIKHAPFTLEISSRKLQSGDSFLEQTDRFRIVNYDVVECGKFGSDEHTGSLAEQICWPQCDASPILDGPSSVSDTTEKWEPLMLTDRGRYRVCWCPSHNNCDQIEDFNSFIMTLLVVGVERDQSFACVSLATCKITIKADAGLKLTDYIQIIPKEANKYCGRTERASVNFFEYGTRVLASPPPDPDTSVDKEITFDMGVAKEPGVYHVCYCQSYEDCSEDVYFFQTAGILRVSGISQGAKLHMCYMKTACEVTLLGTLLTPSTDALMMYAEHAECGTNSQTYGSYFRNKAFPLVDGGFKFLGKDGTVLGDLVTAIVDVGLPTRAGTYRMCYCDHHQAQTGFCTSRTDFRLAAGYMRIGGVSFPAKVTCMQGEECEVGFVGHLGDDDTLLLIRWSDTISCGDSEAKPAEGFGWNPTTSKDGVRANPEKNNQLELKFNLPRVDKPGKFRLCLCGKVDAEACTSEEWWQWKHDGGELNVLGVIHEIRQYGLATPRVVSVQVETVVGGGGIHCSVSESGTLDHYTIPNTDELIDCMNDKVRRGPTEATMPLCLARGSLEGFGEIGNNTVHIPLTGFPTENLHVWCFTDSFCQSKRCVSPPTSDGLIVPITGALRDNAEYYVTSVGLPFDFRVATEVPAPDVRLKIIDMSGSCEMEELTEDIVGLSCLPGTHGKCDPEPVPVTTASGESMVMWQNLLAHVPQSYQVCYCDRHDANKCLVWEESGKIEAQGPAGHPTIQGNPGSEVVIALRGRGFTVGDRVRIVEQSLGCYLPTTTQNNDGASANSTDATATEDDDEDGDSSTTTNAPQRALVAVWQSGAPAHQNTTYEEWRVRLNQIGTFTLCWCGGPSTGGFSARCQQAEGYTLNAGVVDIDERKDCLMSEVIIVEHCTKPCGGGTRKEKRRVVAQAKGGGVACASDAEEVQTVDCNEDPCPLARLDSAELEPPAPTQGDAFKVTLKGMYLANEDRLLIIEKAVQCGQETKHAGGSTCRVINRMEDGLGNELECGDGIRSVILQKPGEYRLCFCDATAAILRNADGSNGIASSPMTNHGAFSAGCSATAAYVLSPTSNAEFLILEKIDPNTSVLCSNFAHAAACGAHSECTWQNNACALVEEKVLGMPLPVFVTTAVIVAAGFVVLFMLALWYRRRKRGIGTGGGSNPYRDLDNPTLGPAYDDLRKAQEHYQMMQHWDAYYQSLGYPAGTAWLMLGGDSSATTAPPGQLEHGEHMLSITGPELNAATGANTVLPVAGLPQQHALLDARADQLPQQQQVEGVQRAHEELSYSGTWGDQLKNLPLPPPSAVLPYSASNSGGQTSSFIERVRRASVDASSIGVSVKQASGGSPTPRIPLTMPRPMTPPSSPTRSPPTAPPTRSGPVQSPPTVPAAPISPGILALEDSKPAQLPQRAPPSVGVSTPVHTTPQNKSMDKSDADSLTVSSDNSLDQTPRWPISSTSGDNAVLDVAASPVAGKGKETMMFGALEAQKEEAVQETLEKEDKPPRTLRQRKKTAPALDDEDDPSAAEGGKDTDKGDALSSLSSLTSPTSNRRGKLSPLSQSSAPKPPNAATLPNVPSPVNKLPVPALRPEAPAAAPDKTSESQARPKETTGDHKEDTVGAPQEKDPAPDDGKGLKEAASRMFKRNPNPVEADILSPLHKQQAGPVTLPEPPMPPAVPTPPAAPTPPQAPMPPAVDLDATFRSDVSLIIPPRPPPADAGLDSTITSVATLMPTVDPLDSTIRSDTSLFPMHPPTIPAAPSSLQKPPATRAPPPLDEKLSTEPGIDNSLRRPPPPPPPFGGAGHPPPGGEHADGGTPPAPEVGKRPPPPPPPARRAGNKLSIDLDSTLTSEASAGSVTSPMNAAVPRMLSLGKSAARSNAISAMKPSSSPKHLPGRIVSPSNALVVQKNPR